MSDFAMTLTQEQLGVLQDAICCAKLEWSRRADTFAESERDAIRTLGENIKHRLAVLETLKAIAFRHEATLPDVIPYTGIDDGREPAYESLESMHGVGRAFFDSTLSQLAPLESV